jgi:CheY-like chemotaxis protein
MDTRHNILLVDDDPDLSEVYRGLLAQLPTAPEVKIANSGQRALAMLEAEPFRLLLCDLKMPKMDGLQVLSIGRRKYPQVRTVALTGLLDEQYRSRAYAMGVDLFWHKPTSSEEIRLFTECIESLLGQDTENGFRGIQSKSLVDLIQLECISRSSSVLRITNGSRTARIWIQDGDVTHAETETLQGEPAFRHILSWKGGAFDTLPAEPNRERTIFTSYNALLLESAQALDESRVEGNGQGEVSENDIRVSELAKIEGLEFVLALEPGADGPSFARGLEHPQAVTEWARGTMETLEALGERLQAGRLESICGLGLPRNITVSHFESGLLCAGWSGTIANEDMTDAVKRVTSLWHC